MDVIARLPDTWSGDTHDQETFLASYAEEEIQNYDTECSNHHPSLSTLRLKGLSLSKMKWGAISTNLPMDVTARLPHPGSEDTQG